MPPTYFDKWKRSLEILLHICKIDWISGESDWMKASGSSRVNWMQWNWSELRTDHLQSLTLGTGPGGGGTKMNKVWPLLSRNWMSQAGLQALRIVFKAASKVRKNLSQWPASPKRDTNVSLCRKHSSFWKESWSFIQPSIDVAFASTGCLAGHRGRFKMVSHGSCPPRFYLWTSKAP